MRSIFFIVLLGFGKLSWSQSISEKLRTAFQQFEADSQMRYGISSFYVSDAKSGETIFAKNERIGLAPASTQKIITSVSAFEILGAGFRYQTQLAVEKLDGNNILHIIGMGDPTLGSWRWETTSEFNVLNRWVKAIQATNIKKFDQVFFNAEGWDAEAIPDGWIWQDIANYYGAGASVFNWRENQYDIILKSGIAVGDKVSIVKTVPAVYDLKLVSQLRSAAKGTGDNAYVYYPFGQTAGVVRGTIPVGENSFKISATLPNPFQQFLQTLADTLSRLGIKIPRKITSSISAKNDVRDISVINTDYSPGLDSIIYWFNKKSINLYGEALIKTMGVKKTGVAVTDTGANVIRDFWKEKGIDVNALNMYDGSGLSPLNRVTTEAQVEILKYAKQQPWFQSFYYALPEYNGMKIKSGTIADVKAFCGYHTSKDGREYVFSIIVNNYGGRTSLMVSKIYKLLDVLK